MEINFSLDLRNRRIEHIAQSFDESVFNVLIIITTIFPADVFPFGEPLERFIVDHFDGGTFWIAVLPVRILDGWKRNVG